MIILTAIVGLCLLWGERDSASRVRPPRCQRVARHAPAIAILTLVLPNYTVSTPGPVFSPSQLAFIAIVSLVLYGTFVFVQAVRHRDYFLPADAPTDEAIHAARADDEGRVAERPAPDRLSRGGDPARQGARPKHRSRGRGASAHRTRLVGVIIAAVVLFPEGLAALRAARANRLQTSLNLALGSALASIGLTIPTVAIVSLATGLPLTLGIDIKSTVLLILSLFVTAISLGTGRTTVLQGTVLLVIFATYLFTTIVP